MNFLKGFGKQQNQWVTADPAGSPPPSSVDEIPPLEEFMAPPPEPPEPKEREILALDIADNYTLNDLLSKMVELGASDLHLESGNPPILRLKGDMRFSNLPVMTHEFLTRLLSALPINDAQKEKFKLVGNLDFAHELPGVARFRVNWLKQYRGIGSVIRVIPSRVPTMEEMGLPDSLRKLAMSPRGIVLVTGPTGSGKSTTLAAMINYVNNNRKAHIITIEDPIEFSHMSARCLIDHREVGQHAKSFAAALRSALREDPDIILVGEMRDLETIALALTAAEMGVLVFGTLHTNSASKTVDRIIDVFPSAQQEQVRMQLSQSLKGVVAQQLLKRADGSGRVAALEVMFCTAGLASLIREGKSQQIPSFIVMGKDEGMQTLDNHLIELIRTGVIRKEDALERAQDLTVFKRAGIIN